MLSNAMCKQGINYPFHRQNCVFLQIVLRPPNLLFHKNDILDIDNRLYEYDIQFRTSCKISSRFTPRFARSYFIFIFRQYFVFKIKKKKAVAFSFER